MFKNLAFRPLTPAVRERLMRLCKTQLRVGALGFGGPLATMAFMRDELVTKEKMVDEKRYLEGLGVVKLLPGPVSTLLAVFLGQEVAGFLGGFLSAVCFVFPSFLMLLVICLFEQGIQQNPKVLAYLTHALSFLQAAVISIILWTCWKLFEDSKGRAYFGKRRPEIVIAFAVFAAMMAYVHISEFFILLGCGLGGYFLQTWISEQENRKLNSVGLMSIFGTFYLAGLTVFGTGYMVLPYLQRKLVDEKGWIHSQAFLNGVAYGNLTPGPVVIASTYFGYQTQGFLGALAATLGIFAGPVMLMLCLGPYLRRYLGRPWVEGVLLGLLPAVAATIAISLIPMAQAIDWNLMKVAIALATLFASYRKIAGWKILLSAGVLGVVLGF